MTKVAILPVPSSQGSVTYWAMARDKRSHGATAGEALDALTAQLSDDEAGTLVIIQSHKPDEFFSGDQQHRLTELMALWRRCRSEGKGLPSAEKNELERLVEVELAASAARASLLANELRR
jgi:hypothetical protein